MTTVGSVTPEWDPPYQATTIRGVRYKPVFDGRAPPEHLWGGVQTGAILRRSTGFGRVERCVDDGTSFAVFRDGAFVLPMRMVLGAAPAVSLRDLVGLIARDADTQRNTDVIRETRDMIEHMLELHPDSETDTLLPLVPRRNLKRVLRVLAGVIPAEVERFRQSGDGRWLVQQLGSDKELAADLGQPWATAGAVIEPSFVETEGSVDELLVGSQDGEDAAAGRWQYSTGGKALATVHQPYTGRGAGVPASFPDGHYGSMLRDSSTYRMAPDQQRQVTSDDWAYTTATKSVLGTTTNFALAHLGKAEQVSPRGRRSVEEQVEATEKAKLPVWRRPHPKGGRTARARLQGNKARQSATDSLDFSFNHTWQNSTKGSWHSWPSPPGDARQRDMPRTMPVGCGTHPSPRGTGRVTPPNGDAEWTEDLRSIAAPADAPRQSKHWRFSNTGDWTGAKTVDCTAVRASAPGHGGSPWALAPTKKAGQQGAPESSWRYAMQEREMTSTKPAAFARSHPDREGAQRGPGAAPMAEPASPPPQLQPSPPAREPEEAERMGHLWRLRGAVPPGRLWSPSDQGRGITDGTQRSSSLHEPSPSGGGTSGSLQEFRANLPDSAFWGAGQSGASWRMSTTQRSLGGGSAVTPHDDTALSPRGGQDSAQEVFETSLAARSPPNTRPRAAGGRSPRSHRATPVEEPAAAASPTGSESPAPAAEQEQEQEQEKEKDKAALGWAYSTHEEEGLLRDRVLGDSLRSVHTQPRENTQPKEVGSW